MFTQRMKEGSLIVAVFSSWSCLVVFGFLPSLPKSSQIALKRGTFIKMATIEEQQLNMNEIDEAILFGEATETKAPFPSTKRETSHTGNILGATSLPTNALDHSPNNPLINALRKSRYTVQSCPGLWSELADLCPERRAIFDERLCDEKIDLTFGEMNDAVRRSAAAFASFGVKKGVNVAILGENSANWLIADHGIQLAGGASSVRGADAPLDELRYIYEHSDSKNIVVLQGPTLLKKLAGSSHENGQGNVGLSNEHGSVKTIILLNKEKKSSEDIDEMSVTLGVDIHVISDLVANTPPMAKNDLPHVDRDDLSTIVYTSGTTGRPKGVMLTHGNLLHQIGHRLGPDTQYEESEPIPGEKMLSLLPVWHITERTFELWVFSRGCSVVYSNIRHFKDDLAKHKPEWMVLVPRVLEKICLGIQNKFSSGSAAVKALVKLFTATGSIKVNHKKTAAGLVVGDTRPGRLTRLKSKAIVAALSPLNAIGDKLVWSKVKAGFGGQQKMIVSGGSALAASLESFYEICGIPIVVAYGLTECSPLLSHRRSDNNLITAGCVGKPCIDTEVRVVDQASKPGNGERIALPDGEVGVVLGRGPQVMRGYYKNREATNKAVDSYGWFDTGDLGKINPATNDLILTGRCKDTIVLSNGENIEPVPIEDAIISQSDLIEQLMVAGQDGKNLVAIAVLSPTELMKAGYLNKAEGKKLQKLNELVNNPKCAIEEGDNATEKLNEVSEKLRNDTSLMKVLKDDMSKACAGFRPWERVGKFYITLEPFAMFNGLLTQSYKVKRDKVADKYMDEF